MLIYYRYCICCVFVGYATVTKFKTASTYGVQPLLLADRTKPFLLKYMQELVPKVVKTWDATDALFIGHNGAPIKDLNRYFTGFNERNLNIHFTSTSMRSLNETASCAAAMDGTISDAQHSSCVAINGHSSATSKQFYIRRTMCATAGNAMRAYAQVNADEYTGILIYCCV